MNTDIDLFEEIVSVPIRKAQFSVMPKFSFVIPTYKRGELLRYAIESILIQVAGENVEILIGDNNPERQNITEQYVSSLTDNRISYYKHQKNLGAAGTWTRVCQLAQGEWIIMLHDDDMLYSDYFACLKKVMSAYPYNDIVGIFPTFNSAPENRPVPSLRRGASCNARSGCVSSVWHPTKPIMVYPLP